MMEHFFKKLLQNPTAKADDETVITLGLTLMLTSATSSSSSFILRVILEVLTSTNLSLSCRRSTDEKLKKRVNCLYQSLHKENYFVTSTSASTIGMLYFQGSPLKNSHQISFFCLQLLFGFGQQGLRSMK